MRTKTCLSIATFTLLSIQALAQPGHLDERERQNLLLAREEEKLSLDLYTQLDEKWHLHPFSQIKHAEQRHMDEIKALLDLYRIGDPISGLDRGAFSNQNIKKRYDSLLTKGNLSARDAVEAGVRNETETIARLKDALKESDESDVNATYSHQIRASERHRAAFRRWL
jgi:hypothetical protein